MEPDFAEHAGEKPAVTVGDLHLDLERAGGGIQGAGIAGHLAGKTFMGKLSDLDVDRQAHVDVRNVALGHVEVGRAGCRFGKDEKAPGRFQR